MDLVAVEQWFTESLPNILAQTDPRNIVNADETGLFWRDVGSYSVVLGNGIKKRIKLAKDKINILMVCSSAGPQKSNILILLPCWSSNKMFLFFKVKSFHHVSSAPVLNLGLFPALELQLTTSLQLRTGSLTIITAQHG